MASRILFRRKNGNNVYILVVNTTPYNPPCIILVNLYDMSHDQNCMFTRMAEHHQRQSPKVRCGRDRMGYLSFVLCNMCLPPLMLWVRIALNARCTTLCDTVCQWLAEGLWFSPGTPVSSTNKTDSHDINEILLIVALNTIKLKT
jgi:hypothetical protein